MKPIEELRKEFEQQEWVKRYLAAGYVYFNGSTYCLNERDDKDKQHLIYPIHCSNLGFIQGGWFMFQELNK